MLQVLASVAALLLAVAMMMLGNSLLGLTVPLRLEGAGVSTVVTGLVMAAYFAGLLLGSLYCKRLIGQVGHIRAFAGLAAIMSAASLALPLLFDPVSWALLRFIGGFCIAGCFASMESWLNERSGNETRGRVLGIYMIVNYLAIMLGQLTVNIWNPEGVSGFMMAAMLISLCLVPVVLTRVEAPDSEQLHPLSLSELYAGSPLAVVGACGAGLMLGAYYGLGAVFARQVGLSVFQVSLFTGSVILGGLLLQWPIGRLSDHYHRRTVLLAVLLAALLACMAGLAVVAFGAPLGDSLRLLLAVGLLLGGAITNVYPIAMAQAFDYLPRERFVAASSGLLLSYSVGATAGPLLCALVMGWLGAPGFFGFIAAVALVLGGFVAHRMRARVPRPVAAQARFVALPRMSPMAAELDPRVQAGRGVEQGGEQGADSEVGAVGPPR